MCLFSSHASSRSPSAFPDKLPRCQPRALGTPELPPPTTNPYPAYPVVPTQLEHAHTKIGMGAH
eukprot:6315151-Prymnesium_polylepis.1